MEFNEHSYKIDIIKNTLKVMELLSEDALRVHTTGAMLVRKKLEDGRWAWVMDESVDEEYCNGKAINLNSIWGEKHEAINYDDGQFEELIGMITISGKVVTDITIHEEENKPQVHLFAKRMGEETEDDGMELVWFDEVDWNLTDKAVA